jgi:membrane associated rhomboid family serine protease
MFPLRDNIRSYRKPHITRAIVILNALIYIIQFIMPEKINRMIIYNYGFIPLRFARDIMSRQFSAQNFIPLATSAFLHGSWAHLIGNMWTLWIFGDNIEDRLGHFRFAVFYILSGAVAMGFHFLFNAGSSIPAIGASGAIAGVMGAYFVLFPHSRIITLVPIFIIPFFIRVPALIYLAIWFFMQVYSGTINSILGGAGSGVAWWAHIGGFVSGIVLLKLLYPERYRKPVYYDYDYYNDRFRRR